MSGGISPVDDFAVATLDEYLSERVRDQYFDAFGLLNWIEQRVTPMRKRGGDNVVLPINTGENTRGGSYSGYDLFNNQPIDTLRNAYFNFAKYQWPIVAASEEILRNNGSPAQIINLWMEKGDLALRSLRKRLNTDAFSDGTGNGGKNLEGLALLVDSAGTYATINRSTVAQWAANETAVGGALAIGGSVGLVKMFNDCGLGSDDNASVDAIVSTQALQESYEALLAPEIRYAGASQGDGGFGRLMFKGRPWMWDRAATSGVIHFLTADTFGLLIHPERDFLTTPVQSPERGTANQDAQLAHLLVWINLVCQEPRRNGKLTGVV